jgi:hypothetical protein
MTTASESCDTTSQMSLFGETCEPSPERTSSLLWTPTVAANYEYPSMAERDPGSWFHSSPQAIPASHSHSPGSDWARRMTATYGRKLSAFWLSSDPPDSWVRMLQATSIWGSTTCYLTWKKSVTPQGRLLFRLVPSTPRTAGIGSGFLPTPTVGMVTGGQNPTTGGQEGLPHWVKRHMWPTPRAEFDSGRHRGQPDTLHSAVKLWGTPTSRDHKDVGDMTNVPENGLLGRQVLNDQEQVGMKLNSAWVSRMMGYPDGWLILDGEATQ